MEKVFGYGIQLMSSYHASFSLPSYQQISVLQKNWCYLHHLPFQLWNVIYAGQKANRKGRQFFSGSSTDQLIPWSIGCDLFFLNMLLLAFVLPNSFWISHARFGFERSSSNEFHVPPRYIILNYQMTNFWLSKGGVLNLQVYIVTFIP